MSVFKKGALGVLLMIATSVSCSSQAVLLVSLGMPDAALIAYLKQAHQYHIPVVIRGLYTDKNKINKINEVTHNEKRNTKSYNTAIGNFNDTANRVKHLIAKSKVGGMSINPLLFRAFQIKAVPALVVYDDGLFCIEKTTHAPQSRCPANDYDLLLGNIPIDQALRVIGQKSSSSERADFARYLLERYSEEGERL